MRLPTFVFSTVAATMMAAAPAPAASPRDQLTTAAFQTTDKKTALALVNAAIANSEQILAGNPRDREGLLQHALGIGYRARLTKKPGDAKESRKLFEALVASNPRDAEFQLSIGGWHLDAVAAGFLAATVLGAKKDVGIDGINKAVALGGNRAFFAGMAALMRIRLDSSDVATSRALAEKAATAPTPTALDRIAQHQAQALLIPLRAGDGKTASHLAKKLLPFGRIDG